MFEGRGFGSRNGTGVACGRRSRSRSRTRCRTPQVRAGPGPETSNAEGRKAMMQQQVTENDWGLLGAIEGVEQQCESGPGAAGAKSGTGRREYEK